MSGKNRFESGVGLPVPGKGYVRVVGMSPAAQEMVNAVNPMEGEFEERLSALTAKIDAKKPGGNVWTSVSGMLCLEKEYGGDVVQALINQGRLSF